MEQIKTKKSDRSWRDTVVYSPNFSGIFQNSKRIEEEEVDSDEENEMEEDEIPTINVPAEIKEKIRKPWRKALILKLLGRSGPWKIMDHYLTVQKWRPNFLANSASISSTAIWVHILNLPMEYFDKDILVNIGKMIGTPIKIDYRTAWSIRGKFARICVEVDLSKPLLSKICIASTIGVHLI
ncbi:uncharacterized protein LOC120118696 [Hibiscus syriacus]|uniref:uncharacterized protein LOC120118696 n=1 Tax=Hibiscus syriacus TaxID=106335 RepID=UPI001921AAEF|nr:uncharacterized protein LOC120118696 [Hibiscus syriacus]